MSHDPTLCFTIPSPGSTTAQAEPADPARRAAFRWGRRLAWLCVPAQGLALTPPVLAESAPSVPRPRAAASAGAGGAGALSLDQLRERLAARVAEVRDAQDRKGEDKGAPVLKVSVKSDEKTARANRPGTTRPAEAQGAAPAPASVAQGHGGAPHWSYDGEGGPEHWAELAPEFASCARGQRQSPIDIREGIRVDLEALRFDYQPSAFGVIDNGHTIQANVAPGNAIEVAGRRYELVQFHFHRPSEERINGRQFDMTVHLVHKDPQGRLAVVAVLLQQGRQHPLIQQVWNGLPLERHEEARAAAPLDPGLLLPEDRRYYTYMGSLTTPPCSEGVLWLVMKQPVELAAAQIGVFARLYPMNARPVQAASGRLIKESN